MNDTTRNVLIGGGVVLLMGAMMVGMMGGNWWSGGWWLGGLVVLMMVACIAIPVVGFGWHRMRRSGHEHDLDHSADAQRGGTSTNRDARP
jgi:hypothetical protein